jgi:riboflavin kinase/FMN adenylyltransferase
LHEIGADHVVVLQTTLELLSLSPSDFFREILEDALLVRGIVEGFNFRFGRDRAGTNAFLQAHCYQVGLAFREVPAFDLDGRPVSSSRVREALTSGNTEAATKLLGRAYRVTGVVGHGAHRGRTIGFPTANLDRIETLLPGDGVYATRVETPRGRFAGAAHIGPNATFGEEARKLEVHLLDFEGDLYGQTLSVDFVARLRGTETFSGVEALIEQMKKDVAATRLVSGAA